MLFLYSLSCVCTLLVFLLSRNQVVYKLYVPHGELRSNQTVAKCQRFNNLSFVFSSLSLVSASRLTLMYRKLISVIVHIDKTLSLSASSYATLIKNTT